MTPPADLTDSADRSGLALLLDRLHANPDEAGAEYERLRRRLVKFFDWRGTQDPDECADEVLDRLARKLADTSVQDINKYVYGIARLVVLERRRVPARTPIDDVPAALLATPAAEPTDTSLQDCFERCLDELPEESRSLLLQYYDGDGQRKIANRRRLATALGITDNALRSRVQRLRDLLERCVSSCATPSLSPLR